MREAHTKELQELLIPNSSETILEGLSSPFGVEAGVYRGGEAEKTKSIRHRGTEDTEEKALFSGAEGVTFAGEMRNEALERPFAQGGREDGEEIVPSPSGTAASTEGSAFSYSPPPFLTDSLSSITIRYYACDHLGTPRLIMDEQGAALERRDFEPFGVQLEPHTPAIASSRFTVHERDEVTTYDYMHFRFYASSTGRFLKPDNAWGSVMSPQSWNLYVYCQSNPVGRNDPTGHLPLSAGNSLKLLAGFRVKTEDSDQDVGYSLQLAWLTARISLTLNITVDETLSDAKRSEIVGKVEEQVEDARQVYSKHNIDLKAVISVGILPKNVPPGKISVFVSTTIPGDHRQTAGFGQQGPGHSWIIGIQETYASSRTLTHELGHAFGRSLPGSITSMLGKLSIFGRFGKDSANAFADLGIDSSTWVNRTSAPFPSDLLLRPGWDYFLVRYHAWQYRD
ncbi:MAG: RHS repeat domain-containing protein [Acidobacteriota bacterium]